MINEVVMITEPLERAAMIREDIPAERGVIDRNTIGTCSEIKTLAMITMALSMRRRTVSKSLTSRSETTLAVVVLEGRKATKPGVVTSISLYQIVRSF